jgi:hypothetical protein
MGGGSTGMAPETIFDFYFRSGHQCQFCGAFRERKSDMRKHVRTFHGTEVRDRIKKEVEA